MSDRDPYSRRNENAREEMRQILKLAQGNPMTYEAWKMKEVLDHITGWNDAVIASIKSFLAGEIAATPASRGIDADNADTVSSRQTIFCEVTRRKGKASYAELLSLLRTMTGEQSHTAFVLPWGSHDTIENLADIFTEQEETHAKEIREIIAKGP